VTLRSSEIGFPLKAIDHLYLFIYLSAYLLTDEDENRPNGRQRRHAHRGHPRRSGNHTEDPSQDHTADPLDHPERRERPADRPPQRGRPEMEPEDQTASPRAENDDDGNESERGGRRGRPRFGPGRRS